MTVKKILIVEDEKNIVLPMRMLFEKEGYEVRDVPNGIDAIKLAQEYLPDVVFLDIIIPGVSGYLVCEALKQDPNTKGIPVVVISAKTQAEDIERAYSSGADDYLTKPFTPEQLMEFTKKHIKEGPVWPKKY